MSEKRYFKIFSERHAIGKQNKYVTLFDELDKIEKDDDIAIKKNIKTLGINADFLSADKNYLYQLILRSLNEFHHAKTYNLKIKESLISIEILFHKGLYKECLSLISKAEAIAEECENFQLMIDLLMWKKKCCGYSLGLKKAAEVNSAIDTYIDRINNLKSITNLYYESNLLQANNEKDPKRIIKEKFKALISLPELNSEKKALSFSAKIFYHLIYSNYYFSIDNKVKEFEHLQKLVDILNTSKTYAVENPLDYISIYNRLLSIKKYFPTSTFFDDIKVLNEFSKKVYIKGEVIVQRVFIHANTHELEYYLINNDFRQALVKTEAIQKEISKLNYDIEPYHLIYFYYLQAIALIYVGQFHKALKFVNKIRNDFVFEDRPQVFLRVEVINIILHYELKNYTLVRSLAKQLLKKDLTFENLVPIELNILYTLIKISDSEYVTLKEEAAIFKNLANEINTDNKKQLNSLIENYNKWILAKAKRKLVIENT